MKRSRRFRLLCISSLLGSLCASAPPSEAAVLRGRVEFQGSPGLSLSTENIYAYRPPLLPPGSPGPRVAVVYLEDSEGKLPPSPERDRAAIDQKDETFVPRILAVETGTRVAFPNSDPIYHNVFSLSKTKRFDLGRYPQGESRSVVFTREGVVRVFCEIHSHMSAFVVVLPHSYFSTTGPSGGYLIEDIPPGTYTVVAWSDSHRPVRREIHLQDGEERALDFVLSEPR